MSVVRFVHPLLCFKLRDGGGSWFGDRVLYWFDFGQGVNKSDEETLVT